MFDAEIIEFLKALADRLPKNKRLVIKEVMHRNMNLKRLRALRALKGTERISSASLLNSLTSESVDGADFCSVLA